MPSMKVGVFEESMVGNVGNPRTRQTPDVLTSLWFPHPRLVCKITNTGAVLRSGCLPHLVRVLNAPDIHIVRAGRTRSLCHADKCPAAQAERLLADLHYQGGTSDFPRPHF